MLPSPFSLFLILDRPLGRLARTGIFNLVLVSSPASRPRGIAVTPNISRSTQIAGTAEEPGAPIKYSLQPGIVGTAQAVGGEPIILVCTSGAFHQLKN